MTNRSFSTTLTDEHLATWRRDGYCVVENFVHRDIVDETLEQIHEHVPTWEQFRDDRDGWPDVQPLTWHDFPFDAPLMNELALNPELISFARRALDSGDIMLSHSESMAKYAGHDFDFDQKMHMDYGNNTFVVPVGDQFDQMASITYFTDVSIEMGPTHVVAYADGEPWSHTTHWTRDAAPELFTAERALTVPAGSIFLYSMRTFHRGSAMTATTGMRHSLHVAYQHRSMTWGGWRSYVRKAPAAHMAKLVTQLSPDRRSMLGFPAVGDPYWTPESIEAVQRRYPDMDLTPYR